MKICSFIINFSFFIVFFTSPLLSQEIDEKLFDIEDFEERELVERLERLHEEPLDLNTASLEELLQIPWFYPTLVRRILSERKRLGRFEALSQLKGIRGMTEAIFELVTPYLKVVPVEKVELVKVKKKPFGKGRFRGRVIEKNPLEDEEKYLGDSRKVYSRLDFEPKENFSVGFLVEKDPGEESYTDLLNYHLAWMDLGVFQKIIFGHYELDFGEGLLFSASSFTFKGSGIVKGSDKGLRPYRSSNENGGLFGGAIYTRFEKADILLYSSFGKLDGTLNPDSTVKSLDEDGFHRSVTEIEKKDRVRENLIGGRASFHQEKLKIGITGYTASYDPPFNPEENPRNPFQFEGKRYTLTGIDFEIPFQYLDLFGEVGYSINRGWGSIFGILYQENPVNGSILIRYFDDNFYSPHSYGFANSDDENEIGSFAQLGYRLSPRTQIRGYLDFFRYPERRFFEDLPTVGREFRGEIEHRFKKNLEGTGRIWQKGREEYSSQDGKIHWQERRGIRITGSWSQSRNILWKGRVEVVESRIPDLEDKESGNLLFGEFRYEPFKKTTFNSRFILFDTDSYESRIYEYERDLPGTTSNPALFDRGRRFYFVLNQKMSDYIKFSAKFSTTYKENSSVETYGAQVDLKW
jgi:hypothetical protein